MPHTSHHNVSMGGDYDFKTQGGDGGIGIYVHDEHAHIDETL